MYIALTLLHVLIMKLNWGTKARFLIYVIELNLLTTICKCCN